MIFRNSNKIVYYIMSLQIFLQLQSWSLTFNQLIDLRSTELSISNLLLVKNSEIITCRLNLKLK